MNKRVLTVLTGMMVLALLSTSAMATTWTLPDVGSTNVYSVDWNISSPGAGAGTLAFTLLGFETLDGHNGYEDIFELKINGTQFFEGSFDLGGGGGNFVIFQDTRVVTSDWSTSDRDGGSVDFTVSFDLLTGNNAFLFNYAVGQTSSDESWGLKDISVTVPEPATLFLLGVGLIGLTGIRRKFKK